MCHATSNVPRKSKELVQELNHCNHLVLHHNWCAKHGLRFVVAWVHHIFCPSGILRHRRDQLWDPSPSFTVHLCHIWDYRNHSPSSIPSDSQMWTNWPQPKAIITLHNMFQLQLRLLVDIPLIHKPAFKSNSQPAKPAPSIPLHQRPWDDLQPFLPLNGGVSPDNPS